MTLQEYAKIQQEKQGQKLVIPLAKEYLLKLHEAESDRNPYCVHPSEMAKKEWCPRATAARIVTGWAPTNKFNFTLQTIFDEGHQIHDKWQTWLKGTGKLWGNWQCRICHIMVQGQYDELETCQPDFMDDDDWWEGKIWYCPVGNGEPLAHDWDYKEVYLTSGIISGHEDAAVDDRLVEFKSVGIGTLRHDNPGLLSKFYIKHEKVYDLDGLWVALDKPLRNHIKQTSIYLWLAREMGLPFKKASVVYEFKPNQQSREFVISLSNSVVEPMLDVVDNIEWCIQHGMLPKCPFKGCKNCKAYEQDIPDHVAKLLSGLEEGTGARDTRARASEVRHAQDAGRSHRLAGREPDEAVQPADGMAKVPGDTASAGRGKRKVLRTKTRTIGEAL